MTVPERTPAHLGAFIFLLTAVASVAAVLGARSAKTDQDPDVKTWNMPSCPRELTLRDGTRWAKPDWSDPNCEAVIGWRVTKP